MTRLSFSRFAVAVFFILALSSVEAQAAREGELPLRKITLFSSGVGYFEHAGNLSGPAELVLSFPVSVVNDALKSLVINDPASSSPAVRYPAEGTVSRTLQSLAIDLSGNPGVAEILAGQRGAEIEVAAPSPLRGRILGIEYRAAGESGAVVEAWLALSTAGGIRQIALKDIASFSFTDPLVQADLNRALDLILSSRDSRSRNLTVSLGGQGARDAAISYVIGAPVWKAAYRLDLGAAEPFLQGWALVDNDSALDWRNVELSLVTGRPVSFIQNLYAPLRLSRPLIPLSIAGIAEARTYDSGWDDVREFEGAAADSKMAYAFADEAAPAAAAGLERGRASALSAAPAPAPRAPLAAGVVETAAGQAAGDMFEFTFKAPVTLERQQSAMLPLVEGKVSAEKVLVFSGEKAAAAGRPVNPAVSAELVNTTGMKLPAGPVTVFDGGTYAGDALIEFFPENEKRIISYGEDLSVSGSVAVSYSQIASSVTISKGLMTITRRQGYERVYTLRNASAENKRLVIEHPVTGGTSLAEPAAFSERTANLYRFTQDLPGGAEISFKVREERPLSERITLSQLRQDLFAGYASNQEIPANVRAALQRAVELRQKISAAEGEAGDIEARRARLVSEQDRIRRNLEAAGNQSPQGQDYLSRLSSMDADIDTLNAQADTARNNVLSAVKAFEDYLASIEL